MFERFTDRARRVVVMAQDEARLLDHDYIGTEHLLLGLLREGEGVAAKALEQLGISLDSVRAQVEVTIGRGTSTPVGHIPFTARSKKALELSLREALDMGHNYIGTEHILLGLIREGTGVAAQVLGKLGADLSLVRQQVLGLLSDLAGEEHPMETIAVAAGAAGAAQAVEGGLSADQQPGCPRCGSSLAETAALKHLDVAEPDGGSATRVAFVYCSRCGIALGPLRP